MGRITIIFFNPFYLHDIYFYLAGACHLNFPQFFVMTTFLTISIIVAFTVFLYYTVQLILFIRLRRKLKNANRDTFLKLLGGQYRYKPVDENTEKYKWSKGMFIIRAHFDKDGKPVGAEKISWRRMSGRKQQSSFN